MEITKRKAIFSEINSYCYLSKEHDYIEVTEWSNGDGVDVNITDHYFSITWGQFKLLKKMMKKLDVYVSK